MQIAYRRIVANSDAESDKLFMVIYTISNWILVILQCMAYWYLVVEKMSRVIQITFLEVFPW